MNHSGDLDRQMSAMAQQAAEDLNMVLQKDDILGIEVYQGPETPQ